MLGVPLMLVAQNRFCSKGLHRACLAALLLLAQTMCFLEASCREKPAGNRKVHVLSNLSAPSRSFSCFSGQTQEILFIINTNNHRRRESREEKKSMEKDAGGGDKKQPQQSMCSREALDLLNCVARNPYDQDKCLLLMQSLRECIVSKKVILFKLDDQDQGKANPGSNKT